jgi:serine/threonine protein kinase
MMAYSIQHGHETWEESHVPVQPDFIRVAGRYRVGKLLGSGASGTTNLDSSSIRCLTFLGSVFSGKDIRTGADVALKIGYTNHSSSSLSHEYDVYMTITGNTGIPSVHWFGEEGQHKVIVLEHLGTSLGDLISEQQFSLRKTFVYTLQMVCSCFTFKK